MTMVIKRSAATKLRNLMALSGAGTVVFTGICVYKENAKFYSSVIMPTMHKILEPETAHNLAVTTLERRLLPKSKFKDPENLSVNVFGLKFSNPVGIAAGFDKDARAACGLWDIGFGFVEVGSVTPRPQPGNDQPRLFRLSEDQGVINRFGFNSEGHDVVLARVKAIKAANPKAILGVNLGKNKTSPDAAQDYAQGVKVFGPLADYLVINVSSPNTPGLRSLQGREELKKIIGTALEARSQMTRKVPILLKVAPDLSEDDREDIALVVNTKEWQIDGLIVSNTTTSRPKNLQSKWQSESGGLSGRPLREKSTQTIREFYKLTQGKIPIIGVGGIFNGSDASEKMQAGASLIQIYSSMVFEGPPVVTTIKAELSRAMAQNQVDSLVELIGSDHRMQ